MSRKKKDDQDHTTAPDSAAPIEPPPIEPVQGEGDPSVTPPQPPDPAKVRRAEYVIASGPKMRAVVGVIPFGPTLTNPDTGEVRSDLALEGQGGTRYQTKALYSEKGEPGTWRYID